MKRLIETLALTFVTLIFVANYVYSQETFANTKLYEAVVNRLFHHEPSGRGIETQLRYTYCNAGEMQILFRNASAEQIDLEIWHLPAGSPTIWNQLAVLVTKTPTLTTEQAVGAVKMQHESVKVPRLSALGKAILEGELQTVDLTGDDTLTLDGMTYGIVINSLAKRLSVTLQGPQEGSSNPTIRWMAQVRVEVEREASGKEPRP
jgi:hypothetical protein